MGTSRCSAVCLALAIGVFASCGPAQERIVTSHNVRMRAEPASTAEIVAQLPLGSRVEEVGRTGEQATIGGVRAPWYEVRTADGKRGWIFGGFTALYDAGTALQTYRGLLDQTVKADPNHQNFEAFAALHDQIKRELEQRPNDPEFELLRLDAANETGARVPFRRSDRGEHPWVTANRGILRYFEPGGMWETSEEAYASLLARYPNHPVTDLLAWRAAQPDPGECEDDARCWFLQAHFTADKYLRVRPNGAYADSAIARIADRTDIAAEYACWDDNNKQNRTEESRLTDMERILSSVRSPAKGRVLDHIRTMRSKCEAAREL